MMVDCESTKAGSIPVRLPNLGVGSGMNPDEKCRSCGGPLRLYPGAYPRCENCRAYQLWMGKSSRRLCVSGAGRTDQHRGYIEMVKGKIVCAFCHRP